jgi:Fe-S cluster assembly ATP-binding protein
VPAYRTSGNVRPGFPRKIPGILRVGGVRAEPLICTVRAQATHDERLGKTHVSDLEIHGLHASIDGKEILKGIDLELSRGEIHAVMGPNGSGKSTLANVLMGHPAYEVTAGSVRFKGVDLLELEPNERSRLGVFLAFQYPHAVPGVTVSSFMRQVINAHRRGGHDGTDDPISVKDFAALLRSNMELLEVDRSMAGRYLNDGFSGGEKKRIEILQMAMLKPQLAILDETDSGLDIDALKVVANGVNHLAGPELGVLVITHYQRLLDYVRPDRVHVLIDGRIDRSGGPELALELEAAGYASVSSKEHE